jgi:hypothetical protein
MHVAARARLVLARRPWIYWAVVATLAVLVAGIVQAQLQSVATARDQWGTTRTVLVATRPHEPGEFIDAAPTELPVAVLPDGALTVVDDGAVVRQRVAAGEVVTELDVTVRAGPASMAEAGSVVVAVSDPLARDVTVGLAVQVAGDGVVLADHAVVTAVVDGVVFVAVDLAQGPQVAAAAHQGTASLLYLP